MNALVVAHRLDKAVLKLYQLPLQVWEEDGEPLTEAVELINEIRQAVLEDWR